jgi:hypothetical protein
VGPVSAGRLAALAAAGDLRTPQASVVGVPEAGTGEDDGRSTNDQKRNNRSESQRDGPLVGYSEPVLLLLTVLLLAVSVLVVPGLAAVVINELHALPLVFEGRVSELPPAAFLALLLACRPIGAVGCS